MSVDVAGADDTGSRRTSGFVEGFRLLARVRRLSAPLLAEQDRWFLWIPVLFGSGILIYFALPAEPPLLASAMPVPAALMLALVWRRGIAAIIVTACALAVSLGFFAAKLRSDWVAAPILERPLSGVEVEGFVENVEPRPGSGQRLTLRVTKLGRLAAEQKPHRVRIRTSRALPGLQPGDAIRIRAALAPPAKPTTPGGYDFARAAWFSSIGAVGYAVARPQLVDDAGPAPWSLQTVAAINRFRQSIDARISAAVPGETGAIASALLTGERGGISAATNNAFRDSGLIHILSISGLHMVIMAGAVFVSVRFCLALMSGLALRYPIKKWAALAAIIGAFGYLLISGQSYPTVRAWITTSIVFSAILMDRPAIALRNIALAALAVMALVPESVFDAGFQMSFAAVVALVSVYEFIRDRADQRQGAPTRQRHSLLTGLLFFGGIILTTLVASAAVAPFSAYHFHQSQQYAILANLIAIPICNILVMPAALASLVAMPFGLESIPLWFMAKGIEGMVWCAYAVAALPGAVGVIPAFSSTAFALMIFGGLWLCLWRGRWRLLGIVSIAAGLAMSPFMTRPDVLIGNDARLVAVRGADGRLSALAGPGSRYELERWLERDGDSRTARQAGAGSAFRCDATGCTTTVKERRVSFARHPAALADDCRKADILVITFPKPAGCQPRGPVIDFFTARDEGTHAIEITGEDIRVVTVAAMRGDRPWSRRPAERRALAAARAQTQSRLRTFASPFRLMGAERMRAEYEDDEARIGDYDADNDASGAPGDDASNQ